MSRCGEGIENHVANSEMGDAGRVRPAPRRTFGLDLLTTADHANHAKHQSIELRFEEVT